MAKVRSNIIIDGIGGMLGNQLVFKRDKAGRTILSVKPTFGENRVFSAAQRAQQEAFREAQLYAKTAKSNPVYVRKAAGTARSAYNVPSPTGSTRPRSWRSTARAGRAGQARESA